MSTKKLITVQTNAKGHWVGDGFAVRTIFDYGRLGREMSPFLMMDYAAPKHFAPAAQPRGVGEHPHRGFETVTVVYEGELEHRDSAGNSGKIQTGDVQWMTAASGIVHEEFHSRDFTRTGGTMEMVQLWVNLPAKDKMSKPGYQEVLSDRIPVVDLPNGAGRARIIAGQFGDTQGAAKTHSPLHLWDLRLKAGTEVELRVKEGFTASVFVLKGELSVDGKPVREADLALFEQKGETVKFRVEQDTKALFLGGQPLNEPIAGYGPFVMNTREEIQQAFQDYQSGKMGHLS